MESNQSYAFDTTVDHDNGQVDHEDEQPHANTCDLANNFNFIGYIIIGFLAFVANFWMGFTILRTNQLRKKELLVFCGLCLGDMIFGGGNFITGCRRLHLACQGRVAELVSIGFCLKELHPVLLLAGSQLSALMMLLLSIDRLMAVVIFTTYMTFTKKYSTGMVVFAIGYTVLSVAVGTIDAGVNGDDTLKYPAICIPSHSTNQWYARYFLYFNTSCSIASIVIYVLVVLANFIRVRGTNTAGAATASNMHEVQMKTQRRLTVTLGIVSLCTFFFHTIPFTVLVFGTYFGSFMKAVGPYMGFFFCINACVNIFIFSWRHNTMRAYMLCGNPNLVQAAAPHQSGHNALGVALAWTKN